MAEKIDDLVKLYIEIRDARAKLKKAFTQDDDELKAGLELIEAEFKQHMDEAGAESVGTKHGVIYKTTKRSAKVADWNTLLGYVKQHDAFDLLTKNVSKDAVFARIEETDAPVPGVDIYQTVEVGVRRK